MSLENQADHSIAPMTLTGLKNKLDEAGIDFSGWGDIPGSKPIESLLANLNEGECSLKQQRMD